MARTASTTERKAARAAVLALDAALASHRRHPDTAELWQPAARRAVAALVAATANRPLVLALRAGTLQVDDGELLRFGPDDRPFGILRSAGIGELELARGLPAEHVECLLAELLHLGACDDVEAALEALLATARRPGVILRAVADLPAERGDRDIWQALPPPFANTPELRALVERDAAANLPALAARQLLDDFEAGADAPDATTADILQRLLRRMLAADDVKTITWLLTELQREPRFDPAVREHLHSMVRAHCSRPWLEQMLDRSTTDELLALSALVMLLGDDHAEQFAQAAAAIAHPMSQWLGELLGR
ncbi:MAG TPA: hypothetical protein ENI87_02240 [bacterium]|nr:hypothetical protein [bacterium]